MTLAGSELASQLQHQVAQLREQSGKLTEDTFACDGRAEELLAKHGETVLELARHYLPDIASATVEKTFVEVRTDLKSILTRQQRHRSQLEQRIEQRDQIIQQRERELAEVTAQLNQLVARREELEAALARQLDADAVFQQLSRTALGLERELAKGRVRVDEVRHEAAEKLPSYEASELFQYLYGRGFGSRSYRGWGLFRRLDRWVATLIGFDQARQGYDFLRATPEMMRLELERRTGELEKVLDEIDDRHRAAQDQIGLSPIRQEGERVGSDREQLVASLGVAQRERSEASSELAALDSEQSEFYTQAIGRMREFLGETDQAVREARAQSTEDREDDAIVAEIGWLEGQLQEARSERKRLSESKVALLTQIEGLEYVVRRFRQSEFDSDRSQFPDGFAIGDHIDRFLRDETNREGLWVILSQNQHFEPTWMESTARSVSRYVERDATRAVLSAVVNVAVVGLDAAQQYQKAKRGGRLPNRPGGSWFTRGGGF